MSHMTFSLTFSSFYPLHFALSPVLNNYLKCVFLVSFFFVCGRFVFYSLLFLLDELKFTAGFLLHVSNLTFLSLGCRLKDFPQNCSSIKKNMRATQSINFHHEGRTKKQKKTKKEQMGKMMIHIANFFL